MFQTQHQSTVNYKTARAGLILAAAIAAAAVIGQFVASNSVTLPDVGSGAGAVTVPAGSTWQSDADVRRAGATRPAARAVTVPSEAGSRWQSSVYEQNAGASDPVHNSTPAGNSGGGGHRGGLIPQ